MKTKLLTFVVLFCSPFFILGQPVNLLLSTPEKETQNQDTSKNSTIDNGFYAPTVEKISVATVNSILAASTYYNYNIVDPTTRVIDTSYPVGSTNGTFNVNPMGAATYSIPIDLPSGINGLNPNLTLVYSSMGGSGIAGYGWQVSGISAISRTSQTFFQDGQSKGVNLDQNDRFALEGQRLVCTSGTYGSDGSQYRTESDIFTRVTEVGLSGTGPAKFKAETKSGHIFEYGSTADAVQQLTGFTEGVSWYVSSVSDLFGNKINYTYLNQNGIVYPSIIEYGPNRIVFSYTERTDAVNSYFKGVKLEQKLLLDKVEVTYNNTVLKTYELKYNYLSNNYYGQSALNEVVEYGTSGSRLNSTAFSYQQPGNLDFSYPISYSNTNISTNSILYSGDFNGDGKEDIFAVSALNLKDWKLYLAEAWGFSLSSSGTTSFTIDQAIPSDLNGDGKDDLILIDFNLSLYSNSSVAHWYAISTGSSFGTAYTASLKYTSDFYYDPKFNYSADFDGDGVKDCIAKVKVGGNITGSNSWYIYSMFTTILNPGMQQKYSGTISSWGNMDYVGDFNGDGKSDIWVFDASGVKIYTVNGNSLTTLYSSTWPTKDHKFILGDFNSDGKTDMFVYGYTTYEWTEWQTQLSTGTGFESHYFPAKKTNLKDDKVYACDFNGDGRTDIMALSKNASNTPRQYYFIANLNGDGISSEYKEQTYLNKDYRFTLGDYDGNGQTDVMVTSATTGYRLSSTTGVTDLLLKFIGNGMGNIISLNYNKLTDSYSNYIKGSAVDIFPVFTYQGPLNVVKSVLYNYGYDSSLDYAYQGLKIHRQGKGFLCFEKTTVTENVTGITTENQYKYDPRWFSPELTSTTKRSGTNNMSVVTNEYLYNSLGSTVGNNRFFPYISKTTEQNVLTGETISSEFLYDGYGNVNYAKKVLNIRENEVTNNTIENIDNSTQWLLGRATNSTTVFTGTGTPLTKQSNRTYSPTSNLVVSETYFPSTSSELLKSYEYFSNGNLKKEITIGDGISRTIEYEYEPDNIHVKKITDPLVHATNRVYNPNGWLQSETDYLGNSNNYGYDNFGRQTSQTNYDGSQVTSALLWFTGSGPTNARYYFQKTGNDGAESKTWYDKNGREIRSDVKGFNGTMIAVLKTYNSKGELASVSEPYYETASPSQYTNYTYDSYGRQAGISKFTGSSTNYSYDANTVTETTNDRTTLKSYNTNGSLGLSVDPGGTLTYSYYPDGKPYTISRNGLTIASMSYDAAGNQTQLNDISAGAINSTYTKFGELKTQTNANGNVTTFNYSPEGLISSRETPEGTTTYTYNDNKQLTGISNSTTAVSRTYSYDTKGRATSISETILGYATPFLTGFTYDLYGRLSTRTHPSGIIETNIFDSSSGYLSQILADGQAVWTINTMDERQNVRTANYGSNGSLNATFNIDTYGLPSSTIVGSVQNYSCSFDPIKGNLNWRKNEMNGLQENFYYDELDRLTQTYRGTTLQHENYYDEGGNISYKSDAGFYAYLNSNKPYTLSEINSSTLNYIANQNINYTSFEKVNTITEGTYSADFVYNADDARAKMTVKNNNVAFLTRTYIGGSYIKESLNGVEKDYTFVGGDAYSAPVVIESSGTTKTPYFLLRDYLGNITHIASNTGSLIYEYSYDAWGRQRNPSDWTNYAVDAEPTLFMGRGFTGHEHLPWFNLTNMNGRLYDPLIGRFLSPDNYVQTPGFTQGFNRYGYCLNNPLKYTDPDGDNPLLIAALLVGAVTGTINVATHWDQIDGNFWKGAGAFGIGFGAGFVGTVTGGSAFAAAGGTALGAGGFFAGSIGAGVGYIYSTGFQGIGNNTLFGDPMPTAKEFGMGLGFSMLTGGTLQGINAVANGRNFLTGNFKPVNIPQPFPVVKLEASKIELNKDALTTKMESMPDVVNQTPGSQTFTKIESGDGNVSWVKIDQQDLTLSSRQLLHNGSVQGKSLLTVDPSKVLSDLNSGNFQFVQLNYRSMPIVKFNYSIGNVISKSGQNLGSTSFGTVHINSLGQVHTVPWLPH